MRTHIFLDTMVWLHYQPVAQIDWPSLLGVDQVTIVVPRITIRELDRQKNQHSIGTIRERAARVLADLEEWLRTPPTTIRERTEVIRFAGAPAFQSGHVSLDPAWNDDALLASILAWQETTTKGAILVTQDTGPALTASDLGINTVRLPDNLRLPPALEEAERELARLRRENLRLQAAQPILTLSFPTSEPTNILSLTFPAEPPRDEAAWSAEREALAAEHPPAEKLSLRGMALLAPSELERYSKDRFTFLERYRDFQIARWEHARERSLVFPFEPQLNNTGTQPADEIDVVLHVPDPVDVFEEIPGLDEPRPPRPPQRPMSHLEQLAESMRQSLPRIAGIPSFLDPRQPPNVSQPEIRKTNSHSITYSVGRLKHGDTETLAGLLLRFQSRADITSFHVTYTIGAANLIEPTKGVLHVRVEK